MVSTNSLRPKLLLMCLSPDFGGLEQHVRDFAHWLARQDEVEPLLALREDSRLHASVRELGLRTIFLEPGGYHWPWRLAGRLARQIEALGIDLIHTHWRKDLPLAALAKRRAHGIKPALVHTQHMLLAEKSKRDPYHRLIYGVLDGLVCVSAQLAAQAQQWLPVRDRAICTIYPGVPPLRAAAPAPAGVFNVGVIGRILPPKGQHLALQACALLREQGIMARTVFAGEVHDEVYTRQLREYAQQKNLDVEWRGFVEPDAAFAGLGVLAMCTDAETFGLVTVEALRRGVPVAGSDSGGTREILDGGMAGLLFAPGDATALARVLERLYRDTSLVLQLTDAGQRRAAAEFDADTQFGRVLDALLSYC